MKVIFSNFAHKFLFENLYLNYVVGHDEAMLVVYEPEHKDSDDPTDIYNAIYCTYFENRAPVFSINFDYNFGSKYQYSTNNHSDSEVLGKKADILAKVLESQSSECFEFFIWHQELWDGTYDIGPSDIKLKSLKRIRRRNNC